MFTDKEMEPVIEKLTTDTKELFDIYEERRLFKTTKQKSEDISGLLENAMEDLIEGAVAPKIDSEPDIRLNGEPVEIKTSGNWNAGTWQSGGFSKRDGHFIFVLWELDENNKLSKIIWMKLEIIEKYHESLRYICSDTTFNTNMYRLPLATISTLTP